MSMTTDLRAHLASDPGVSGIATSVRLNRSEHGDVEPRVVIHLINSDHKHHLGSATGKAMARVQIDCFGTSPVVAESLAEAVRLSLDGFRGRMNGGVFLSFCHLDNERTAYSPPLEGEHVDEGVDSVQLDYQIGWTVSVPVFS